MVILEAVLNRLRGTGVLKHFGTLRIGEMKIWKLAIPKIEVEIKLVWNHVYALYLALVFGIVSMNILAGLAVLVAYLVGESKGWGEWVGALTRWETKDEEWLQQQYKDNEGVGFPYIHQIANAIVKEQIEGTLEEKLKQYHKYARLALTLRGMFWWGLVYGTVSMFGIVSVLEAVVITVALGIGFPVACYLGKKMDFTKKFGVVHLSRGWENQELVYGLMQGVALWYVVLANGVN